MTAHLDRDRARTVLAQMYSGDALIDALEACVVQGPPTTINRDALDRIVDNIAIGNYGRRYEAVDAILTAVSLASGG